MAPLSIIANEVRRRWRHLLFWGVLFALLHQVAMFAALLLRFRAWPNYVTFYDWPGNVLHIVRSTPSVRDMVGIIREEWLIEIGRMNYDYGTGISEWSLNIMPSRLLVLCLLGALVGLAFSLLHRTACASGARNGLRATTGLGAFLVALTNVTMSWVVCCATPSWVVGLAMLGLGTTTSLALERSGPLLSVLGFGLLTALILYLAWRKSRPAQQSKGAPAHA
ncbi:hypothetical protein [Mameliella sp.]|uniref:hypothetical protein n=1 Tax=Mameliella sp. TaxID=1924940 RepID=UPI003B5098F0